MAAVHLLQKVQLLALHLRTDRGILQIADAGALPIARRLADGRSLIHGGQERAAIELHAAAVAGDVGRDGQKRRKILIVCAESVGDPGPDRRPHKLGSASVKLPHRRSMGFAVGFHAKQHAEIVGVVAQVGQHVGDRQAGLTPALEARNRTHQSGIDHPHRGPVRGHFVGQRIAAFPSRGGVCSRKGQSARVLLASTGRSLSWRARESGVASPPTDLTWRRRTVPPASRSAPERRIRNLIS